MQRRRQAEWRPRVEVRIVADVEQRAAVLRAVTATWSSTAEVAARAGGEFIGRTNKGFVPGDGLAGHLYALEQEGRIQSRQGAKWQWRLTPQEQ